MTDREAHKVFRIDRWQLLARYQLQMLGFEDKDGQHSLIFFQFLIK